MTKTIKIPDHLSPASILSEIINLSTIQTDLPQNFKSHFKNFFNYNFNKGKQVRYNIILNISSTMEIYSSESMYSIIPVCAFLIEYYQTVFLIADDIMDSGSTRRGQVCWHRTKGNSSLAVNDILYSLSLVEPLLDKYIEDKQLKDRIFCLFDEMKRKTCIGQALDMMLSKTEALSPLAFREKYSWANYEKIVLNKTSFYSFIFPLTLPLLIQRLVKDSGNISRQVEFLAGVGEKIGMLFQAQDDFIDVYGDIEESGKVGTDIQEGKCTWLLVKVVELCEPEEVAVLNEHLGSVEGVGVVKEIYEKYKIKKVFKEWEKEYMDELIECLEEGGPFNGVIVDLLSGLFNRKK